MSRKHYFENVPNLGHVAVSRHAQAEMDAEQISESMFESVLLSGVLVQEGNDITWREGKGIRIVILNRPEPFRGAKLVKTVYRIEAQAVAGS